jgi:methyltransferase-like protein
LWFLEFCEMLEPCSLRFLAEADLSSMLNHNSFSAETRTELQSIAPGLLEQEQYLDFLYNRSFRQTLVCHDEQKPTYALRAASLMNMHFASAARPLSSGVNLSEGSIEQFQTSHGTTLSTPSSVFKAAMLALNSVWPAYYHFEALLSAALDKLKDQGLSETADGSRSGLARSLLTSYSSTNQPLIQATVHPPELPTKVYDQPRASQLAIAQVASGLAVTNLRHETVMLDAFEQHAIVMLDGQRGLPEVSELLLDKVKAGDVELRSLNPNAPQDNNAARLIESHLEAELGQAVNKFQRCALLLP